MEKYKDIILKRRDRGGYVNYIHDKLAFKLHVTVNIHSFMNILNDELQIKRKFPETS